MMVIYNSLGQEIERFVVGKKGEGSYNVKWDGSNAASGIYFVRVGISDDFGKPLYQDVKKLMLVK
jgi:hypothetical protein